LEVILHLGSNIEPKLEHIQNALQHIKAEYPILSQSTFYKTQAWGEVSTDFYINVAIQIECKDEALALLEKLQQIEKQLGRVRTQKWGDRIIDIDIIFIDNQIIDLPELQIPHPLLQERNFVLAPLNDIVPNMLHPKLHKTVSDLFKLSKDTCLFEPLI
jgi:2-amino-4-hydroxy-6-hydroxymethyldihydropteridine diphosphokinase